MKMSQYCYKDKHAPPGARYPNGLPCTCKPCKKPPNIPIAVNTSVYSDLGLSMGKKVSFTMPKRAVPTGENRKTAFFGGDGETSPKAYPPNKVTISGSKRKSRGGENLHV